MAFQDWDSGQILSFVLETENDSGKYGAAFYEEELKRNYSWEKQWIIKDDR